MRLIRLSCTAVFTAILYIAVLTAVQAQAPGGGDSDGDGVGDIFDKCDNTPPGTPVGDDGCPSGAVDNDNDGVPDDVDLCLGTDGGIVNNDGCNGSQLIESICKTEDDYKNHGDYVSCVTKATKEAVDQGLIETNDKGEAVSGAAKSDTGKKK